MDVTLEETEETNFPNKPSSQPIRDALRKSLATGKYFQLFVSLFFILAHDTSGLFSASSAIKNTLIIFENEYANLLLLIIPVLVCDVSSEMIFVFAHDYPKCEDDDEKIEANKIWIYIGFVGQVITGILWLVILSLVMKDLVNQCSGDSFFSCDYLSSTGTKALVVVIVFLKNITPIMDFFSRKGIYPILLPEEILFLTYFKQEKPEKIVDTFEAFHELNEEKSSLFQFLEILDSKEYHIFMNFTITLLLDISAIASVTKLILTDDDYEAAAIRSIPFVIAVVANVISHITILRVHDLPLIKNVSDEPDDTQKKIEDRMSFTVARVVHMLVLIFWILILVYLCYTYAHLDCQTTCTCPYTNTTTNGTVDLVYYGDCAADNSTTNETIFDTFTFLTQDDVTNCTLYTEDDCLEDSISLVDCVLLTLILLENIYSTVRMFFKSYIYTIVVPEYVLFFAYWRSGNKDAIVRHIGKSNFGIDWEVGDDVPDNSGHWRSILTVPGAVIDKIGFRKPDDFQKF